MSDPKWPLRTAQLKQVAPHTRALTQQCNPQNLKPLSSVCVVVSMLMYDNELPFTELLCDRTNGKGLDTIGHMWSDGN